MKRISPFLSFRRHPILGFLIAQSVLGGSLGWLSWALFFAPASLRAGLARTSVIPVGAAILALVWLAGTSARLSGGESRKRRWLLLAVLFSVAGQAFFFWLAAQIFSFTLDDAFITFRYARNLAAGWGPTYNPGRPPVEGYTSFLWMLVMALPHLVGAPAPFFAKVMGLLCLSGTFFLVRGMVFYLSTAQRVEIRLFSAAFAEFLLALLPLSAAHAVSGMETALFTLLVTLLSGMVVWAELQPERDRLFLGAAVVGLLTGLTRPEGNVIAVLVLGYGYLTSAPERRRTVRRALLGGYVLPGALYFLWRWRYYALPLPLPFYVKILRSGAFAGAKDVSTFLAYLLPPLTVFLLVAALRFRRIWLPVALPVIFLLTFYLFPKHIMGVEWRFLYPATPSVAILVGVGGAELFDLLELRPHPRRAGEMLLLGLLLVALPPLNGLNAWIQDKVEAGSGIYRYRTFGELLHTFGTPRSLTLALGDAGTVPYYADWNVIDLYGLNNREIALGEESVNALVFDRQPADLLLLNVGPDPTGFDEEHAAMQQLYRAAVSHGMSRIGVLTIEPDRYYVWVVAQPDAPLADFLRPHLGRATPTNP